MSTTIYTPTKKDHSEKPLKLMIKKHMLVGIKYLCKTEQEDHNAYSGSGKYWKNILNKHGKEHVRTKVIFTTHSWSEFKRVGLLLSEQWDIVDSDDWANLIPEGGEGGGKRGPKHSQEFKDSQSVRQKNDPNNAFKRTGKDHHNFGKDMSGANNAMFGVTGEAHPLFDVPRTEEAKQAIRDGWAASDYVRTPEHAKAIGDANKGRERPQSEKDQISESLTGLERVRVSCVKCQEECSIGHLKRFHIDAKVCGKENKKREPQKKVKCPHCPKIGGESNMLSFHFDNCLKNPNLTKEEVEALKQERRDRRKGKA